jgi:hypothetical protein
LIPTSPKQTIVNSEGDSSAEASHLHRQPYNFIPATTYRTSPTGGISQRARGNDNQLKTPVKRGKITVAADIPRDISNLDCEEIGQCLLLLKLSKHREKFAEGQIDGSLLTALDIDTLVTDFSLSKFEATKLMRFSTGWRPNVVGDS